MKILGIDPGIATTGYGLIENKGSNLCLVDYGCILTTPKMPVPERLNKLFNELSKLIKKQKPDEVAIEELFFAKNVKTAMSVSQARGVIVLSCIRSGMKAVNEYTPLEVKMALVGYGRAEKQQVQKMVTTLLNLKEMPKPDDAADALAIAVCHFNSRISNLYKQ
ncbi:MAG: crossover junction endodeoxyribonuclease RuvC [Candidatus Firestonebacteria bacterium RIFOXYC2_FULL_39_67]|nr:MAG: crossover junction endodeoxyribonuclease RuvC [Candidatus Firestonebacteria bacterium RIFOXYD2_FULL_39_29]OGF54116.1 MAG: crossover junction endodeoxyribonuclease RuvC [Candidatus Firestonebacteria bacterium RIFOXYC2_FULL_39_67]